MIGDDQTQGNQAKKIHYSLTILPEEVQDKPQESDYCLPGLTRGASCGMLVSDEALLLYICRVHGFGFGHYGCQASKHHYFPRR